MKELFAGIAVTVALGNAINVAWSSDTPDMQRVLANCTVALVFALLANAARRGR